MDELLRLCQSRRPLGYFHRAHNKRLLLFGGLLEVDKTGIRNAPQDSAAAKVPFTAHKLN